MPDIELSRDDQEAIDRVAISVRLSRTTILLSGGGEILCLLNLF
jgi:hypothetical protein